MYCPKCGIQVHEASLFCASCGTRLSDLAVSIGSDTARTPESPEVPAATAALALDRDLAAGETVNVYAGFWRRAAAAILDTIVVWVALMILVAMALGFDSGEGNGVAAAYLLAVLGTWLYCAVMESSSRQATLGKMALGIKVAGLSGQRIGFWRATGRYFGKIVSNILLCVGYVMAAFTRRRQCLHDMMAGAVVIKKETSTERLAAHPYAPKVGGWAVAGLIIIAGAVPGLGILASTAIPAYQDYTIRAQVADGLASAAAYKAAVEESLASKSWSEIDSDTIGLGRQPSSRYLESIDVVSYGVIVLRFGEQASEALVGSTLLLVPGKTDLGTLVWVCGLAPRPAEVRTMAIGEHERYTDVEPKYLPAGCRP